MKLIYLKKASDYKVKKWLNDNLELSPHQKEIMCEWDFVRHSPFYFYTMETEEERKRKRRNIFWRMTFVLWLVYVLFLAIIALPIMWIVTGNWGLQPGKFVENFHKPWARKLGL